MRPVHVAGFAHIPVTSAVDEAEMVQAVTAAALEDAGLSRADVGFTCSGSNDYVMGRAFSFTMAIDGLGARDPIRESHVEMDGAWALYEAYVRLQHGDVDVALAYSFGRSTFNDIAAVGTLELDPYTLFPLAPDPIGLAALQARALLDQNLFTEADFAAAVAAATGADPAALHDAPYVASPLRAHDEARRTDGAAAVVLVVDGPGPRISGLAHRIDVHQLGQRDLTDVRSARLAAEAAGASQIAVAELHTPFSYQVPLLRDRLGLAHAAIHTTLTDQTPMVAGLAAIGKAARHVRAGAPRALAHATSGPCLQHNLIAVLEAR